jgi:transglutaminase-like putative cysteine protease
LNAPLASARERPELSDAWFQFVTHMATFLALAAFALAHWETVVRHAPIGRGFALLGLCGVAGFALWLTGQVEMPVAVARATRILILFALIVLGLMVSGLRPHYIWVRHWGSFGNHLNHGLLGAQAATYPYAGTDHWVRLTLQLAAPAFLIPATALAFWPSRRAAALRTASLVVLIVFYGMALVERSPGGQVGRGLVLLLLIAAWMWLPRVAMRDAGGAVWVVICAAVVAMPVAAILDSKQGWFDYRNWRVLGNTPGVSYQWNQSYGPINWPRRGTTLLYMQANRPYYWKAETLNEFDGRRWLRTGANTSVSAASELPNDPNHKWFQEIKVTVAGLRSNQIIGAGTPQSVSSGAGPTAMNGDGTVTALEKPLHDSENYSMVTYVPEPTVKELQAKGTADYQDYFSIYTRVLLPLRVGGHVTQQVRFDPGLWHGGNGDPESSYIALHSPYAPMYRLTKRIEARSQSAYDMVRNVERYLGTATFNYDEHPPARKYPLESFLTQDHIGYCQQFSGTMALMLRMAGIPARVVSGFAPGSPQADSPGVYKVRDFDAHAWVEVYFNDIGWVTFDPTPSASPASSQSDDVTLQQSGDERKPPTLGAIPIPGRTADAASGAATTAGGATLSWWMIVVAILVVLALVGIGWRVRNTRLRHAAMSPDEVALEDLRNVLGRLGSPVRDGTTLTSAERTLRRRAGPEAAGYARRLREYRYGAAGATLPNAQDRRALRKSLARRIGRFRALRALPPLHLS